MSINQYLSLLFQIVNSQKTFPTILPNKMGNTGWDTSLPHLTEKETNVIIFILVQLLIDGFDWEKPVRCEALPWSVDASIQRSNLLIFSNPPKLRFVYVSTYYSFSPLLFSLKSHKYWCLSAGLLYKFEGNAHSLCPFPSTDPLTISLYSPLPTFHLIFSWNFSLIDLLPQTFPMWYSVEKSELYLLSL